jgi:hypothetical protein
MKLELKHLAPYLPYTLKVWDSYSDEPKELYGLCNDGADEVAVQTKPSYPVSGRQIFEIKPILRPLSDLVKECELEYNPEENGTSWVEQLLGKNLRYFNYLTYKPMFNNYWEFERLVKNHFDVFGLIEKGLAININTI